MAYATVPQFRAYFHQITAAATDEALIEAVLDRASAIVDGEVGAAFGTAAAGLQTVYGDGTDYLFVPAFVPGSVTGVTTINGYTVPAYVERDGLLVVVDSLGRLRRPGDTGLLGANPSPGWQAGIPYTVAATYGYDVVPHDITEATLEIAGRIWQSRNAGFSDVVGVEGGGAVGYQKAIPATARRILDRWRERASLGVW